MNVVTEVSSLLYYFFLHFQRYVKKFVSSYTEGRWFLPGYIYYRGFPPPIEIDAIK